MIENIEKFKTNGYVVVKDVISEELRDFVTQCSLFDEMQNFHEDGQVLFSHGSYANPVMETMLVHLHSTMEKNTGLKLFPTYSYYRVYRNDADLKPHIDRPSCEISATLCFNYNYDDKKFSWPIYMNGNKVVLNPGDMVIYRGCDLGHWRDKLEHENENVWQVQGFFHYVDANGPYENFKYDQRESIGIKKLSNKNESKYPDYIIQL